MYLSPLPSTLFSLLLTHESIVYRGGRRRLASNVRRGVASSQVYLQVVKSRGICRRTFSEQLFVLLIKTYASSGAQGSANS